MVRKLNIEQEKGLQLSMDFSLCILNFIGKTTPPNSLEYHKKFEQVVLETFENRDIRGMKYLLKDITEWARGLNQQQKGQLNQLLRLKFNKDLNSDRNLKKIKQIVIRGKINDLKEYKLLADYFEEIFSCKPKKEVDQIDFLLQEFQRKTGMV